MSFEYNENWGPHFVGLHLDPSSLEVQGCPKYEQKWGCIREEETEGWQLGRVPTMWAMKRK